MYLSIVLTVILLILTLTGCFNKTFIRAKINRPTFVIILILYAISVLVPGIKLYGVDVSLAIPMAIVLMVAASIKKPKYGVLAAFSAILLSGIIYMVERTLDINEFSMNGLTYIETAVICIIISIMSKDAVIAAASAYFCSIMLVLLYFSEHVIIGDTFIYLDMDLNLSRAAASAVLTMIITDIAHSLSEWSRRRKEEIRAVQKNA